MKPYTMGSKVWPKAVVSEWLDEWFYIIETDEGSYRQNRVDIEKTREEQPYIESSGEPPGTSTEEVRNKPVVSEVPEPLNTKAEPDEISTAVERHVRPKRNLREPAYLKDYVRKKLDNDLILQIGKDCVAR